MGRRVVIEALGTAFLLATVVGSGIMGERLAGGNIALALLANSLATGAAIVALILAFGPISGAHFNPAVTLMVVLEGRLPWSEFLAYVSAQIAGAFAGVLAAAASLPFLPEIGSSISRWPSMRFLPRFAGAALALPLMAVSCARSLPVVITSWATIRWCSASTTDCTL